MHDGFNRYLRTGHNTAALDGFNRCTPGTDYYGGFDHGGTIDNNHHNTSCSDDNRYDYHRIHQRSYHSPGCRPGRTRAAR